MNLLFCENGDVRFEVEGKHACEYCGSVKWTEAPVLEMFDEEELQNAS